MQKNTFILAEAAALLRCHTETLRKAILEGRLPAARIGRSYRISRVEIQKFWRDAGGGELFDKDEEADGAVQTPDRSEKKKIGPSKPEAEGPRQLNLPLT
ncbi:MAG: helix-turn-helix domain-containing protein [Deltaproteobacteria bacterium]|jgi:excisionase family DNA binding protein|nr:helix-turn-helix domain-containing protein [Deltaproteobacteria bacterium]